MKSSPDIPVSDWLCRMVSEPDYAFSVLQATAERGLENLKIYLQAVEVFDTIIICGIDSARRRVKYSDPRILATTPRPQSAANNDYVHQHSDVKTMPSLRIAFQPDGALHRGRRGHHQPRSDDGGEDGPLGTRETIPAEYLIGGQVDTQTVLPYGTAVDVREQAKERIRIFAPGGGFVRPIHNIQYGVPPKNIVTMVDTAWEYGEYPIH